MITMADIARQVGVSQATVSYVLNGRQSGVRVRDEMRQRILDTATELGYRRNDLARAMASGKSYVLSFVTRIAGEESSARILMGAQEVASEQGYTIRLLAMTGIPDYATAFARLAEQRVAGVLVHNLKMDGIDCLRPEMERFGIPVVLLSDPPIKDWTTQVVTDDTDGMRQALEHLLELGHRQIGFVGAQRNAPLAETRRDVFLRLMQEKGLSVPDDAVLATDWNKVEHIEPAVRTLLGERRSDGFYPTALLTAGDHIAMVTMRTARALGLHVPRDLSVIGFADFISAVYADPPLTTIAEPFEEMGRLATQSLLNALPHDTPQELLVPTHLVLRDSTAPPRFGALRSVSPEDSDSHPRVPSGCPSLASERGGV